MPATSADILSILNPALNQCGVYFGFTFHLLRFQMATGARIGDVLRVIQESDIVQHGNTQFRVNYIQEKTNVARASVIDLPPGVSISDLHYSLKEAKKISYETHNQNTKTALYPHRAVYNRKDITTHLPRHYFIKKYFELGKSYPEMKILTGISAIQTLNEYRYSDPVII